MSDDANEIVAPDESVGLVRTTILDLFEIDVRSLAALRICLGALILIDLIHRLPQLDEIYVYEGIVDPDLTQQYLDSGYWSLFWIDGSPIVTKVLLGLTALAGFFMMVGFRTRASTIAAAVLTGSLHVFCPLALTGGHILLRVLLVWSIFLPMGAVWSYDNHERIRKFNSFGFTSIATAGIMLQVAFVYFFSGLAKCNGYWLSGEAIQQVLGMEMYVKPLGAQLQQVPAFLKILTWLTLGIEVIGPILLFIPRYNKLFRGMFLALFWLMHIGVWSTMSIGIFSLTAMSAWLIFIPQEFWDMLSARYQEYDQEVRFAQTPATLFGSILAGVALVVVFLLNVSGLNSTSNWLPNAGRFASNITLLSQEFKLFGTPPKHSPQFRYLAELNDRSQVDIFYEQFKSQDQEADSIYKYFPSQHWRRIHSNLMSDPLGNEKPGVKEFRQRLLDSVVSRWNEYHTEDRKVHSAQLICTLRVIDSNGKSSGNPNEYIWAEWNADDQ